VGEYENNLETETDYLQRTLAVIKALLEGEQNQVAAKKSDLIASRRDMYENTAHFSDDFEKLTEMVQHLSPLEVQTYDYGATAKRVDKYNRLLNSPYFARVDFIEEEFGMESIYIGLGNVMDDDDYTTYVYDWRAPIASIFYRYELGKVSYQAPVGTINGEAVLKRQYEIEKGKLQYFFDSNVSIMDDMLKKALSDHAADKMKTIVETIQREQDIIIRDIDHDLVIVQGAAGSGKTSVALHRVAFLMYQSIKEKLGADNIIMISPNSLFGRYISNVLPELGEENVATLTFENIFPLVAGEDISIQGRNSLLEEMITEADDMKKGLLRSSLEFKLSRTFTLVLERYIKHFERHMIEFSDIHFNGECVADRQLLKMDLLSRNKKSMPIEIRLQQMEARIMRRLQELRKDRLIKLERFVHEQTHHPFDAKAFARLLAVKQSAAQRKTIEKFTKLDYLAIYKRLFKDKALFYHLSRGLHLPQNIEEMLDETYKSLCSSHLQYEDGIALMYLKIRMAGCSTFGDIKQVVVDEVQDYYPMHFEILKLLFPYARYTIVGDINQTIEKAGDLSIYEDIRNILNKKRVTTVYLKKSFRSSYEINMFNGKLIDNAMEVESFDRHGSVPEVISKSCTDELNDAVAQEIKLCTELGHSSIAIICKSLREARSLYLCLSNKAAVKLIDQETPEDMKGVLIIPVYLAKGLEFDAVIVYGADDINYRSTEDKKLLYIACSRALHKLTLYYTGNISRFLG